MNDEIARLSKAVMDAKAALRDAQAKAKPQPVDDWEFKATDGSPVRLSALFGDKDDLILVHNMGKGCVYCTHWADGFRGHAEAIADRAAFVLCSNDDPKTTADFAASRGWNYTCVSGAGSDFARTMGYMDDKGNPHPGISAFRKNADGSIVRTGTTPIGPGDDFCPTWPMFDLLGGANGWEPKYDYAKSGRCGSGCGCH
ncbi:MAG: hypothetical protein DHS20C14_09450 [Phycisphaeraceae bacterium]|nr:MAG: hypothetical protein DHS20C14_09450 [Phycisphaeraceae bacterium]